MTGQLGEDRPAERWTAKATAPKKGTSEAPSGQETKRERRERIVRKGFPLGLPKEAELTEAEGWASKRLTAGFADYASAWHIQTDSEIPARALPVAQPGFNPRPYRRGDQRSVAAGMVVFRFNPRPCTRGDVSGVTTLEPGVVSIHAPARGATLHRSKLRLLSSCFNPRPCTRGDLRWRGIPAVRHSFNPRPCTRGDLDKVKHIPDEAVVSIHAPARGATDE